MKRILLIIPYFGNLDATGFFSLFLYSCSSNETIDFLLLTDDKTPYEYPSNVRVVLTTLLALKERFQSHFDFPISLECPYKLCDHKLTYGELFSAEIAGYDAWGYCDIDMVFGDIRAFVTDERLAQFGRVYTRGHLGIFCTDVPPDFYRVQLDDRPGFQEVLTNETSFSFDEWINRDPRWDALRLIGWSVDLTIDNLDVEPPTWRVPGEFRGALSTLDPQMNQRETRISKTILYSEKGKLYRIGLLDGMTVLREEIIYAHFQKRRMVRKKDVCKTPYLVAPNYFSPANKCPDTKAELLRLNNDGTRFLYRIDAMRRNFKERWRRI